MQWEIRGIPSGEAGTDATVKQIARFVRVGIQDPNIRIFALSLLQRSNLDTRDHLRSAIAIWQWIVDNIQYVNDPVGLELVQTPQITLKLKAGDCDDHTTLLASLVSSLGIPTRLVTVGVTRERFSHIFAEIQANGQWYAADTVSQKPFGTTPKLPVRKVYSITGDPIMHLAGAATVVPLTVAEVKDKAYAATKMVLKNNWNQGLINLFDVKSYLRVIDEGNSPSRGTIVEAPIRQAITDFYNYITRTGAQSAKQLGALNGLEGLDGFLKSIWNGVKSVVSGAVKVVGKVLGGGGTTIQVTPPTITTPGVTVSPGPEASAAAAQSAISSVLNHPVTWVIGGVVLLKVLKVF